MPLITAAALVLVGKVARTLAGACLTRPWMREWVVMGMESWGAGAGALPLLPSPARPEAEPDAAEVGLPARPEPEPEPASGPCGPRATGICPRGAARMAPTL